MEMWVYVRVSISVTFLWSVGACSMGWAASCTLPASQHLCKGRQGATSGAESGLKSPVQGSPQPQAAAGSSCWAGELSQPVEGSHNPSEGSAEHPWGSLDAPSCSQQSLQPLRLGKDPGKAAGPHSPANPALQAQP